MKGFSLIVAMGLFGGAALLVQGKEGGKGLTRGMDDLSATAGRDLASQESEAMREFTDTRALANVGCQYCTETAIILDNSRAIYDKELWMFKLLLKEIAAAFLRVNQCSRLSVILTTQPLRPILLPIASAQQTIGEVWNTIKSIQRNDAVGEVNAATDTAIALLNNSIATPYANHDHNHHDNVQLLSTKNLLLLVAPYPLLLEQAPAAAVTLDEHATIRRFVVGTRMAQRLYQVALEAYAGCPGCGHVQYVGNCTPARFLFLLKRLYPLMCVPASYYREAAIMTFQVDGMPIDDENMPAFVDKFLDLMSQSTGVDRQYLEVIDVRDSASTTGPQYNARRLKAIEDITDFPQDTLMDIVVRDNPNGLRDSPFKIAGKFDTDLRNELSPVASLFNNEFSGLPQVRNIQQPRESIFSRPSGGLTFQKLYLGDGLSSSFGERQTLQELLHKN